MRLLLISNSFSFGKGYLDHCIEEIHSFLNGIAEVLFVPYALYDHEKYSLFVSERFAKIGCKINSLHVSSNPRDDIYRAKCIFVGGGNTFRLLKSLYEKELIEPLKINITNQGSYIGASAGVNIVGPTIKTTNDMPIVYPPSFEALNLLPFHINPHYFDHDPNCTNMMESRDDRIKQFLEENDSVVLGLREDSYLWVENKSITLKGEKGAKLFQRGATPEEVRINSPLSFLLI